MQAQQSTTDQKSMANIYTRFIKPVNNYGIGLCDNGSDTNKNPIPVVKRIKRGRYISEDLKNVWPGLLSYRLDVGTSLTKLRITGTVCMCCPISS